MFEEEGVHFLPVLGSNDDGEVLVPRAGGTVQSAFRNTPCLGSGTRPVTVRVAEGHKSPSESLHRTRRVLASPPEYTMPCCSGPV